IEGIAAYAQDNCSWLLRPVAADEALSTNLKEFDGVIARIADDRLAGRIRASGCPAVDVFCQKPHPGLAGVDSDHRAIGRAAREFFVSRGFANFAYCGFPGTAFSDAREKAYSDESTCVYSPRKRLPSDESQFYDERIDRIQDARSLVRWLKTLPKPAAVFCCNDLRAIQLQRVAIDSGLRVPEDLAILGVDNDTIACSFAEVPISSINPNSFEIGRAAARILGTMIARRPDTRRHRIHHVKPGEITERASTEFMPVDPPWLGNALMHIERNMRRPIAASEIFALSGRSSTFVENVFRDKLGMPVQAYVTSVKMREAKRLIADPSLRISEIAYQCGFSSPQYFCRTFTATFGMNPKACRARQS
ncbi:MAG: substrate-binding domain-containing protein, partial [bacterium]|nr:substrate-binding domain-containing protein [Candidatus Colisoma equi]